MAKIFYGNQFIEKFNCDGKRYTKWEVVKYKVGFWMKRIMSIMFALSCIAWFGYGTYVLGSIYHPKTVFAEKYVSVVNNSLPPILLKIEKCESNGHQYDANGQVLMHDNGGSVDIGILQINEKIWGAMATKMGYDLTKQSDNEAFGLYLFDNYSDAKVWTDSSQCWSK